MCVDSLVEFFFSRKEAKALVLLRRKTHLKGVSRRIVSLAELMFLVLFLKRTQSFQFYQTSCGLFDAQLLVLDKSMLGWFKLMEQNISEYAMHKCRMLKVKWKRTPETVTILIVPCKACYVNKLLRHARII
jgi:hypothetical protein